MKNLALYIIIAAVASAPIQVSAYTSSDISKLSSQPSIASKITFNQKDTVSITLDGQKTILPAPAFVSAGRTLLPVRGVAELLSAKVTFQPEGNKGIVQVTKGMKEILLQLTKSKMIVDGTMKPIDSDSKVSAQSINGTTYLPLRAIAETLGVKVIYVNGTVDIITGTIADAPSAVSSPTVKKSY